MSKKRRIIEDKRGSATVEMSILAPMLIFLVIAVFYSMVYQLDCSIAKAVLNETLLKTADVVKSDGDIESGRVEISKLQNRELYYMMKTSYEDLEKRALTQLNSNLERRLILAKLAAASIEVKNAAVLGKIEIWMEIPILGVEKILGSRLRWKYEFRAENANGAENIRRWDEIESLK